LEEKGRKFLFNFAIIESIFYSLYMFIASIISNRFMALYENFITFIGINFIIMFIYSAVSVQRFISPMGSGLMKTMCSMFC
ncbi:MAG TPA: hypothetical protein PK025_06630, partial [Spirochaetales bacterium]|nr:hypothetical protein [Spirochaetales bacterium]